VIFVTQPIRFIQYIMALGYVGNVLKVFMRDLRDYKFISLKPAALFPA